MKKIIALGGSNSKTSINKRLATYTASLVKNVEVEVLDLNDFDLPLYGIDLENKKSIPADATRLNDLLEAADGLIFSLAEHNGSFTTAFKNAYDWISRIDGKIWKNKPMLLMATSPGGRGGRSVLDHALAIFPHRGGNIVADFSLPSFNDNFSAEGITNDDLAKEHAEKVRLFQQAIETD